MTFSTDRMSRRNVTKAAFFREAFEEMFANLGQFAIRF